MQTVFGLRFLVCGSWFAVFVLRSQHYSKVSFLKGSPVFYAFGLSWLAGAMVALLGLSVHVALLASAGLLATLLGAYACGYIGGASLFLLAAGGVMVCQLGYMLTSCVRVEVTARSQKLT